MRIIITGAGGFLGQRLARALLQSTISFDSLVLTDNVLPPHPHKDPRVRYESVDLLDPHAVESLVTPQTRIIFHLAAIVSSQAEKDFDLGLRVNLDVTRRLLEACRQTKAGTRFVFASSLAVYGGKLPSIVTDTTAVSPRSSYGAQKAIAELLVNDYSRKGFIDGCVLRLPTVCIRPGKPNRAASSFVSSIIREPLNELVANCPVPTTHPLFLTSPNTVIQNMLHAASLDTSRLEDWRTINLPGITVTIQQMLDALRKATDERTLNYVHFKHDEAIHKIVSSWPGKIDNARSLKLGFSVDKQFSDFILQYKEELKTPT